MSKLWRTYQRMIELHPVRTAAVSAGTLMAVGDVLAQTVIEKRLTTPELKYNPVRTLRFLVFGVGFVGPALSTWYRFLAHMLGGTKLASVKMVACDQLLFAPPFLVSFLAGIKVLEGWKFDAIKQKLKDDYKDVLITNYKVWPAVQIFNFSFVPVNSRVIVVNFVAVGWNTYLAWKSEHVKEPAHRDSSNSALNSNPVSKSGQSLTVCEGLTGGSNTSTSSQYDTPV